MTKYSIIHLDDNPMFINLTQMLMDEIHEVDYNGISNKQDAYYLLESELPDLFITDLMLEDDYNAEPGIDLIKTISEKYTELKIMVLSARGDFSLKERLKDYVTSYETKEFERSILIDKIKNILREENANE